MTLKVPQTSSGSPTDMNVMMYGQFAKEVSEGTDGKIDFEFYWNSTLVPVAEHLTAIASGVADLGMAVLSYTPEELPIGNWLAQAGSLQNPSYPAGPMQGTWGMVDTHMSNDVLAKEWADKGVKFFNAWSPSAGYDLLCADPISDVSDVRGRRVTSPGPLWTAELKALGMVPTDVAFAERYEALQRGVVDCTVSVPQTWTEYSFWDVAKYVVPGILSPGLIQAIVMDADLWDSLPVEAQQVMHDAAWTITMANLALTATETYNRFATEGPAQHGIVFVDPTSFDNVLARQQETTRTKMLENVPAGLEDPQALLDEFTKSMDEGLAAAEAAGAPPIARDADAVQRSWAEPVDPDVWKAYGEALKTKVYDAHRPR
ncbi:TRAP transporter substrate-binding protein DctP [Nocardia rhamnosiphila]